MEVAQPNEKLRALLAQEQQLLQQQMRQLLDHHAAAIAATLEKNFHITFTQFGPTTPQGLPPPMAANPMAAVMPEQAAAAAKAATATATATSRHAAQSNSAANESAQKKTVKTRSRIAGLLTADTAEVSSSMQGTAARFMRGRVSTGAIAFVILANTLVMYVQLQWLGSIANASLGLDNHVGSWGSAEDAFKGCELAFGIFFLLEFLVNMYAFRWQYFTQAFNVMDTAIVLVTSVDTFVLQALSIDMGNISYFRMFRLAKFARAIRVVRTMTLFSLTIAFFAAMLSNDVSLPRSRYLAQFFNLTRTLLSRISGVMQSCT